VHIVERWNTAGDAGTGAVLSTLTAHYQGRSHCLQSGPRLGTESRSDYSYPRIFLWLRLLEGDPATFTLEERTANCKRHAIRGFPLPEQFEGTEAR